MTAAVTAGVTLAGYFVFSAAAGAMSEPTEAQRTKFYGWFYRFVQRLAANADRLAEARFGNLAGQQPRAGQQLVATHERDTVAVASIGDGASK